MRCEDCEIVHSVQKERERLVNLKVIVSRDELSEPYLIKIPANEKLRVGDELLVDDPAKDVVMTQIASLETDRRVDSAPAETVKTVWARATDEVPLKISVYRNGKTHPLKISVRGDEVFEVGEVRKVGRIQIRDRQDQAAKRGFCRCSRGQRHTTSMGS